MNARVITLLACLGYAGIVAGQVVEPRAPSVKEPFDRRLLAAANERPLATGVDAKEEIYRLIWVRSFQAPVVLRVEIEGRSATLFVKVLAPMPDHINWRLARAETRTLEPEEVTRLRWLFKHIDFEPRQSEIPGLDGSTWTVEGFVEGKFRTANEWTPRRGPLYEFGFFMIEKAIGGDLVPIF